MENDAINALTMVKSELFCHGCENCNQLAVLFNFETILLKFQNQVGLNKKKSFSWNVEQPKLRMVLMPPDLRQEKNKELCESAFEITSSKLLKFFS